MTTRRSLKCDVEEVNPQEDLNELALEKINNKQSRGIVGICRALFQDLKETLRLTRLQGKAE
jgi:hypothetical protein